MKQYKGILSNIPPKPIVCYDFTNVNSYPGSGTLVTDLSKNSDATIVNGPVYSGFTSGSMYFDGTNDFLITNTSLSPFFAGSSPSKSEKTSIFLWVYPMDNGVILSEQGTSPTPNLGWHEAEIEMVSGTLKFGMWNGASITSITSSIATPLNKWYYLGIVYDGSTLTGYVNGVSAGSTSFNREAPYNNGSNLYYGIATTDFTNMGDSTYARMYLSRFEVFNCALTQSQITYNYDITKARFNLVTSGLVIQLDANSTTSYPGSGTAVYDLTGSYTHTLTNAPYTVLSGVKCFDTNGSTTDIRVNGTGPTLPTSGYTYISWVKIRNNSTTWRTLFRTVPNDHPILVGIGTNNLGYYDNDTNSFISSGYDITPIIDKWVQLSVVGDSSSSTFYVNDINVGSVAYGAGGNRHDYWGSISGQPFGYVANMYLYNRKLSVSDIKQQFIHLTPRFA